MPPEIDHVFVCTSAGAPAADRLSGFGLKEGAPNIHPGQGTACRRFFFRNSMLELLWMTSAAEAQSEQTGRTRLFERLSGGAGVCPFGIILRRAPQGDAAPPFPSWLYQPVTMPGLSLHIAAATSLTEPMWCYLAAGRSPSEGSIGMTGLRVCGPSPPPQSVTMSMARAGILRWVEEDAYRIEIELDQGQQGRLLDLRPDLPLTIAA